MNAKKAKQQRREGRQRLTAEGQRSVFTHPAEDFSGNNPIVTGEMEQRLLSIEKALTPASRVFYGMNVSKGWRFNGDLAYLETGADSILLRRVLAPMLEDTQLHSLWSLKEFFGKSDENAQEGFHLGTMTLKEWCRELAFFAHFMAGREGIKFPGPIGEAVIGIPRWQGSGVTVPKIVAWNGGTTSDFELGRRLREFATKGSIQGTAA